MHTVLWTLFAVIWTCLHCYENLSRRSTSIISVSSNFQSSTPNKANDGNLNTTSIYCSHTDINQTRAWLQVDLGKSYSINSVKIYYRKDGCNKNCINQVCDAFGFCIQGCVDGYWGPTCDLLCPANCKELSCNRNTGQCVKCISGFLGDTCTLLCSSFCYGGVCDKNIGNCTQGCRPGRYGGICDRICSSGCINGTCNQHRGICLGGCKKNWSGDHCDTCGSAHYGPNCSMECSINCLNNTCNSSTGSCIYGCQEGFYGEECDRDCDSCPTQCDKMTGQCIGECPEGRFGEFCNKTCSEDCKNKCNKTTGSCEEGCILGNFGDFCNKTCDAQCLSSCDQKTENIKPMQDSCLENLSTLIGVCVILSISVVVNGCTITWILRHIGCKQRDVTRQKTKGDSHSNDVVSQQEIYDTAEDNAGYQELGQISGPSHYDQLQRSQI